LLTAGVPSSQALPGFHITAPPSVCVSAVLGALAVWIKKKKKCGESHGSPCHFATNMMTMPVVSTIFPDQVRESIWFILVLLAVSSIHTTRI